MAIVGRVVVVLLLVPVVALLVARMASFGTTHPWAALLTVLPWSAVLVLVAGGVAATARWAAGGIAVAVVFALLGVAVAPRVVPGPNAERPPDGVEVTVAVANLRLGLADPAALVASVEAQGVDVLVTLELTEPAIDGLVAAGIEEVLPHAVLEPSRFTSGGGIHARWPLQALDPSDDRGFGALPRAAVTVPRASPVEVVAVHPLPPIDADWTGRWAATLSGLAGPAGDGTRLLAGDFNATHDHAPFRRLLRAGWTDAADAVGSGLVPTFNALPWGEPVPPVTLDHVLVDATTHVADVRVTRLPNSDHRFVVVDLVLPPAPLG